MAPEESISSFHSIPLDKLTLRDDSERAALDVSDLVESLQHGDQLQNVVVRAMGQRFEVVCGRRRVRAAQQLGWESIEAKVVVADDTLAEQYQIEENLRRVGLKSDAEALARLHALYEQKALIKKGGDR